MLIGIVSKWIFYAGSGKNNIALGVLSRTKGLDLFWSIIKNGLQKS
jgi:hypothetical protein